MPRTVRHLLRAPGATLAMVLIIALATGFVSAAATVAYGVLLKPLPYDDADRLVALDHAVPRTEIAEWRTRMRTVEAIAGTASADHAVRGLGPARITRVAFASPEFWTTVRPRPLRGRLPSATEVNAAVVSERVLRQEGKAAEAALGSSLVAVDRVFTIVGVLPADAAVPEDATDLWLPSDAAAAIALLRADDRRFSLVGRLRPGATTTQAATEATGVRRALWAGDAKARDGLRVGVAGFEQQARGAGRTAILALLLGGAVLLLVACANVASLLVSGTLARERELAISMALGASGRRVVRTLFAEAVLLSLAGTAVGLGLAGTGLALLRALAGTVPRLAEARVDPIVVGLAGIQALAVAVVCSAGPAVYARRAGLASLVRATEGAPRRARSIHSVLAAAQLALSMVLLVAALLLARTLVNVLAVPTGVRTEDVLTARVMLGERTLLDADEGRTFVDALLAETGRLPGVRSVGFATSLPPGPAVIEMAMQIVEDGRDETQMLALVAATPAWAETIGVPLIGGRFLQAEDGDPASPGIVLSRSAAQHMFRDRLAVGSLMPTPIPGTHGRKARVVGVVDDVRYAGLLAPPRGAVYVPWKALRFGVVRLVVRTRGDAGPTIASIADIARRLDPARPIEPPRPLGEVVAASVAGRQVYALVAAALAGTAFAVATIGLVATLARLVGLRRREFAVRLAIGETRAGLASLVVGHAAAVIAAGLAVGLPLAWATARGLASDLYGVTPQGWDSYVLVAAGMSAIGLFACAWPAWCAWSTSPVELLRNDG
jgi:putative ABC transport system permease protein